MRWTEAFYSRAFDGLQYQGASFALRENGACSPHVCVCVYMCGL